MARRLHRTRVCFAAVLAAAVMLAGAPALAEPTAAELAAARKAFAEATELEKAEQWVEAEAKLREALAIKETPGLRYHLGFCLESQQKLVDALVEFERADEMLRAGAKAPDVEKLLASARERVKKSVGEVVVRLAGAAKDASVEVDGMLLKPASIGKGYPVSPGKHVIIARKPKHKTFRRDLRIDAGASSDVLIELEPEAAAPGGAVAAPSSGGAAEPRAEASADATPAGGQSSLKTWVLIGEGAVTLAALGAGFYFSGQASDSEGEIDQADAELEDRGYGTDVCNTPPADAASACSQLAELTEQRDSQKNWALAGFIGAGVGAAATVATYFLWQPSQKRAAAPALRVAPVAGQRSVGLGLWGRF